jgi:hypothetical protein
VPLLLPQILLLLLLLCWPRLILQQLLLFSARLQPGQGS